MKPEFETLLIQRKNELQNSARLLEISLLAQRLGVKDAE